MKRVVIALALLLGIAVPAVAQLQSGNIAGTVKDEQGAVLPGVEMTLAGPGATQTFTTGPNGQYRFLNLPPGAYKLTASLPGFAKVIREGIVVTVGSDVEIPVSLKVAAVEESVTVTGESPIVDAKAMGTATNFTQDELSKIPNSRDPWALLRSVPGVQLDRINVGGNETGQQSGFVSKGGRQQDAVWTLDGVPITDMATNGASPTYFDYDAFDEIQISTSGNDIRQATGGIGLNFVVKRGTNQFKGGIRGYFTNDSLESSNVPDELTVVGPTGQRPVTPATADHSNQISDYGFDFGGPILRDKLFAWGSWTQQDIRLIRASGATLDRTVLKTTNVKLNYQITKADGFNFLWFNGDKIKLGRAPGFQQFEPASARYNQGNYYPDNPFHGLWKFEHNRVWTPSLFMTSRYSYYSTGFTLESASGLGGQAFQSTLQALTDGSTNGRYFLRPQHNFSVDANHFRTLGSGSHDFKFGGSYRRVDAYDATVWPGNMVLALENSATDRRARIYREGAGTNRGEYWNFYVGDTISMNNRLTLDLGVRYDRQWGTQIASSTRGNAAFPNLVPGISFDGGRNPFTWSNFTPRVGMTWALDEGRKTLVKASFGRSAGQLQTTGGLIGFTNPSASVGFVEYPWIDANGDRFAQANEVQINAALLASGGGFNPANPTGVTSANRIDPDLTAPITNGIVIGLDRELMPNFAAGFSYSFARTTNFNYNPFVGLTPADYAPAANVTGTIPGGSSYSLPLFIPDNVKVTANGGGRLLTNWDDYYTTAQSIEATLTKRMSNKWMMRMAASYTIPREYYDMSPPVNFLGNPTNRDQEPLQSGGQWAPLSGGSGSGDVFVNAKWSINLNGAYQLPWDMEAAGNLYGKQGTPFAFNRNVAMGRDGAQNMLVSPELDSVRYDTLWNLDLRIAKNVRYGRFSGQFVADLFNVMNSNTELVRVRNSTSPNFARLSANLSPRILRIGFRLGL